MFKGGYMLNDKDIIYITLVDAINKGGCPICKSIEESENRNIWILLYEHVNDPYVRERINRGNGFCSYHFQKIINIAQNDPLLGGLGPAIIVEDLLNKYVKNIKTDNQLETECYMCSELEKIENSYLSSFISKLTSTDILNHYENNSQSILCYQHFITIFSHVPESVAQKLKEIQLKKLEKLLNEVQSYIAKHDYRHADKIKETEAKSWIKAIETIKGSGWSSYNFDHIKNKKHNKIFFKLI
jgi:hypothetical protein